LVEIVFVLSEYVVQKHKNGEADPKPRRLFMLSSHLICTKPAAKWAQLILKLLHQLSFGLHSNLICCSFSVLTLLV